MTALPSTDATDDALCASRTVLRDAENRIIQVHGSLGNCSTATACYVYDAEGRRVQKTTSAGTMEYAYDRAGRVVAEFNSSGGWNRGQVFAGSHHIATSGSVPRASRRSSVVSA